ncbi:MAG TPA: hypothetical protein VJ962_09635 [Clostridia bacterium]|nr:hypothetical protein [Clostridia bacterium]
MNTRVIKRKVGSLDRKKAFDDKIMSFLDLQGGKSMEQINSNRFNISNINGNIIRKMLVDIGERSKIFYNKYLRPTVNYDYLEVKRIRENNIEKAIWDTIRNH